ncbi:SDR family oxidoreductase [Variovorax sp. WS11]|uniref:SDR family NAD(P)-dependent oxidoreductase n=1 Tax=Variovorax sp. WS11 TaxID=1105204 RepID=UPI0013DB536E|nr:SDR family oxidoreductase [Variovorax sp. WS11]NDZ18781.1 SDR family oxidoreductase [Variovorax sp. WS11]
MAVVIGGSGGIGRVVCQRLAQCGCDVALTYRRNEQKAAEVAAMVVQIGQRADSQPLDLTDPAAVEHYYQHVVGRFGRIHSLVVATGADIRMDYLSNISVEEWRSTIVNDLVGFFNAVKLVLPHLRAGGGGSIVALSSAAMARHSPMDILSTGPKGGIESVVRAVAREEGRYGIRANSVGLGAIDTGLMDRVWAHLSPEASDAMRHGVPLRRIGKADEAADAIVFLASERSAFTTGQRLVLDGGFST